MEILRLVVLFVHLLSWAALLGGLLVQMKDENKAVNRWMRDGSGTAFVTGVALVGIIEMSKPDGFEMDHMKVGIKFAISLVVLGLVMANLRKKTISNGLWGAILGLTIANIAVATFISSVHTF